MAVMGVIGTNLAIPNWGTTLLDTYHYYFPMIFQVYILAFFGEFPLANYVQPRGSDPGGPGGCGVIGSQYLATATDPHRLFVLWWHFGLRNGKLVFFQTWLKFIAKRSVDLNE